MTMAQAQLMFHISAGLAVIDCGCQVVPSQVSLATRMWMLTARWMHLQPQSIYGDVLLAHTGNRLPSTLYGQPCCHSQLSRSQARHSSQRLLMLLG